MAISSPGTELLEREELLSSLGGLLAAARRGSGAIAFLSGEAGAGKTALVSAFSERAGTARLLPGACDGVSTPTPLGPLHDMRHSLAHTTRALLQDAVGSRQHLFDALLHDLRSGPPTVMIIEDLHWTDDATLDLLRFLGRRLPATPTLLIATYRDDQVGPFDQLRMVIGDLASLPSTHHLHVPPFTRAAVARLAADRPIDAGRLHELTGGNPFYVAEVLAAGEDAIPTTVRDAVRARIARLPVAARHALEAAAVLGSRVEPWLLAAVAGEDAAGIDTALSAGLLVRHGDAIAFRHELTRLTVLEDLPPIRAIGLHRRALRYLGDSGDVVRLAYHAEGGADAEAVLSSAPEAGRRAVAMAAHAEAIAQFGRALRFGDRLPEEERAAILEMLSYEQFLTNRVAEARSSRVEAIALRERAGDVLRAGDDHRYLSRIAWFQGRGEDAWSAAGRAIELLEPLGLTRELAMAIGNIGHLHMLSQHRDEALAWGRRALELGHRLADDEVICYALNNIGTVELEAGREEGREKLLESLSIAREHDMQEHVDRALFNLGEMELAHHRYGAAEGYLAECLEFTRSCDLERCQLLVDAARAYSALETGRWQEAAETASQLLQHPRLAAIGRIEALNVLARLAIRTGDEDPTALMTEAEQFAGATGQLSALAPVAATAAERAWLTGDDQAASEAARHAYTLALECNDEWAIGELAMWLWRAGALSEPPENAAQPFWLELSGQGRAASAAWEAMGNPYRAALALATVPDADALREAHARLSRLGASVTADFVGVRLKAMGASVPRGPRQSTHAHPAGLTEREAEVASLLALGLTDRQIAEQLVMSPKTAGHHVSAVLGKLGIRRRAEVARVLEEHPSRPIPNISR